MDLRIEPNLFSSYQESAFSFYDVGYVNRGQALPSNTLHWQTTGQTVSIISIFSKKHPMSLAFACWFPDEGNTQSMYLELANILAGKWAARLGPSSEALWIAPPMVMPIKDFEEILKTASFAVGIEYIHTQQERSRPVRFALLSLSQNPKPGEVSGNA